MDVLSEVLNAMKLDGALFYNAEFSAPWCFHSPASRIMAPYLLPDAKHVIIFHLLTAGCGYAQVEGDRTAVPLNEGDIVIFPHGDSHVMGNGPRLKPVDNAQELQRILSHGLKVCRLGGGGEVTKFICGYMALRAAAQPRLSRRPATRSEGQYPRRCVGTMAGELHPPFSGPCGCIQAR